jgi:hypothetical protein
MSSLDKVSFSHSKQTSSTPKSAEVTKVRNALKNLKQRNLAGLDLCLTSAPMGPKTLTTDRFASKLMRSYTPEFFIFHALAGWKVIKIELR